LDSLEGRTLVTQFLVIIAIVSVKKAKASAAALQPYATHCSQ
jgi:hypothetical protein